MFNIYSGGYVWVLWIVVINEVVCLLENVYRNEGWGEV